MSEFVITKFQHRVIVTLCTVIMFCIIFAIGAIIGKAARKESDIITAHNKEIWDQCVSQGGIPISSWRNHNELADCKFKPN